MQNNKRIGDGIVQFAMSVQYKSADLRPELLRFALEMENTLKKHDHKKNWSKLSYEDLKDKLAEELDEFFDEIRDYEGLQDPSDLLGEILDVANVLFMIFNTLSDRANGKENDA